jgi:predicted restriction endonuclease
LSLSDLRTQALERADYMCEWPECYTKEWLELAHIVGIGMGGRDNKTKYDLDNVVILCKMHHDIYDGRTISMAKKEYRQLLKSYLYYVRQ